jgi:ribose-phosphate pyrophosphokinase
VCKKFGAKAIRAVVTHGLLIGSAFEESAIEKMIVTNTVPLPKGFSNPKVESVSVAPLFAKAIDSMVGAKSISSLFQ